MQLSIRSTLGSNAYRAMRSSVSCLLRCSIALALSLGIFLFSLPIYVDIPSIAILLLLAVLAPLANLAVVSLSLLVSLSGAALVISARFPKEPHAEVWRRTKCVFFVPTKLRVYAAYVLDSVRQRLQGEPAGLRALRDFMKGKPAEVVDLTPFLKRAADERLQRGQYVFWRDDTHWNANGVKAVSAEVAKCLTKEE
jgi:hypothetical protein